AGHLVPAHPREQLDGLAVCHAARTAQQHRIGAGTTHPLQRPVVNGAVRIKLEHMPPSAKKHGDPACLMSRRGSPQVLKPKAESPKLQAPSRKPKPQAKAAGPPVP